MSVSNSIWILSTVVIIIVICEVICKAVPSNTDIGLIEDIKESRCGTDNLSAYTRPRVRRVAASSTGGGGSRWNKTDITYRIGNEARTLVEERVEALVAKAFAAWAPYCGLQFMRLMPTTPHADITISFETRGHSTCTNEFDGPGHQLAHATYPSEHGTYIHFDDDEIWGDLVEEPTSARDKGIVFDFYSTALHEIGHSLGLSHTEEDSALMYPYNQATSLHEDDISSIRKLYNYFEVTETTTDDNDYSSGDDKLNKTVRIDVMKKDFSIIDSIENNSVSTDFTPNYPPSPDSIEEIYLRTSQDFKISETTFRNSEATMDHVTGASFTDTIVLSTDVYATKNFTTRTKDSSTTIRSTEMDDVTNTDLSQSDLTDLVTPLYSTSPKVTVTTMSPNNSTEKVVVASKAASKLSATSFFGLCGFFTCFAIVAYYMRVKLIG